MQRLLVPLLLLLTTLSHASIGHTEQQIGNDSSYVALRFDFGTRESPVKPGWIRVTHETTYTSDCGYGWDQAAASSFDREEVFVPDWMKGSIAKSPTLDDMLRDGVFDKEALTFHIDVPNGEYWLLVSIGDEGSTRRSMTVLADGIMIADNITTQTSWGGYATTRTFRRKLNVVYGKLEVDFIHGGDANSILGIELVSLVRYPIWFSVMALPDPRWVVDEERYNPNPGILNALEKWDWEDALAALEPVTEPLSRANALIAATDVLDMPEERALASLEEAIQLLDQVLQDSPPDSRDGIIANELNRISTNYLQARHFMKLLSYGYATEQTGYNFSRRLRMAEDLLQQITEDDPLFDRACLNIGRIHYWFWRENGEASEKEIADRYFSILKNRQPDNRLVRIYTGEQIPWGEEYTADVVGMPEWAVKQREAMGRLLEVIRWWIDNRQLDNGEMGGSYGDDVEMLRQWHVFLGGADDETVKRGWLKLAHGIWYNGNIDTQRGYAAAESDVQHSAEDTADSQPAMIGMDYGNPVWLERCAKTVRTMRDFWTGINEYGHRHFKSASIGATTMNVQPNWGVDVPCSGRATRPGLWLGWYNRSPEVVRLFSEWMNAWAEDAMREEDGKPAGVIPAAVAYETDKIGGYGKNWYEPDIYWSYFNWPGYVDKIYDHLLAVYDWTGDEKYLKPIEAAMDLALESRQEPVQNPPKGSRAWAANVLYGFMPSTIEKYRILTGRTKYDDYLRERGSAYTRFLLTGDKEPLIRGCEGAAASARFNFELKTSEVFFTDRVGVTQHPLWEMLTGGVGKAYYYPCYFVTWRDTGPNFAALVARGDSQSLKVLACNFESSTRKVGMNLWRLEPGVYELRMGPDSNNDDLMDRETSRRTFEIYERGQTEWVSLPPRSTQVIEISKKEDLEYPVPAFHDRPDLAIGDQDIFVGKTRDEVLSSDSESTLKWLPPWKLVALRSRTERPIPITVVVHNLGKSCSDPAVVNLLYNRRGKWVQVDQATISEFEAADDLIPGKAVVELEWRPISAGTYQVIIQVEYEPPQMEITHQNNVLVKSVKTSR